MSLPALLLNYIGAFVRWIYKCVWRYLENKKAFTFIDFLNGSYIPNLDIINRAQNEYLNKYIGYLTLMFIIWTITLGILLL